MSAVDRNKISEEIAELELKIAVKCELLDAAEDRSYQHTAIKLRMEITELTNKKEQLQKIVASKAKSG